MLARQKRLGMDNAAFQAWLDARPARRAASPDGPQSQAAGMLPYGLRVRAREAAKARGISTATLFELALCEYLERTNSP